MGLGRSRVRRMDTGSSSASGDGGGGGGEPSSRGDSDRDLATVLSYLIRSGQVRILTSGGSHGAQDDDDDDDFVDDDDYVPKADKPDEDRSPDTKNMDMSSLKEDILLKSGQLNSGSVPHMIFNRAIGQCRHKEGFSPAQCKMVGSVYLPNTMQKIETYRSKAFCGTYSKDGDIFLSACQDAHIRIYNTARGGFKLMKKIRAKDVGWSVVDTAFSPDGNYLIYSSWSDCVHLCNIYGEHDTHEALNMCPEGDHSFCMFSLMFSADNSEILGGANDGCMYVYDREKHERSLRIDAHEDDINAVAFADSSSHILFSGGDDGLVKVWDRRTLSESDPREVGTLAGHSDGITFIDPRGDGRYLISNCKDQSVKLWDIRKFSSQATAEATKRAVSRQSWDYRWQQAPRRARRHYKRIEGDTSLMTYRGHSVLHTLIRARFSPEFTTGQRYIYSGCATGAVVIYDVLTGKVIDKLDGHKACVRDATWHPYDHKIISTSWDCSLGEWTYYPEEEPLAGCCEDPDSDEDGFHARRTRSRKIRQKREKGRNTGHRHSFLNHFHF